jgi:hypothetical protein
MIFLVFLHPLRYSTETYILQLPLRFLLVNITPSIAFTMGFKSLFVAYAIVICLAALVHCDSDQWGSFIFPPNSTITNFTEHAPIVAKIGDVHFNDDIVVEYTLSDSVKALWLSQECYGALNDTNTTLTSETGGSGFSYSQTGVCE